MSRSDTLNKEKIAFGTTQHNKKTSLYRFRDKDNLGFDVSDYGATLISLFVPDQDGRPKDVILGFDSVEAYEAHDGYAGALCGRTAGRIQGAKIVLNEKLYQLSTNLPDGQLHGGIFGFDKKIWAVEPEEQGFLLRLNSRDGEEGFPGNLDVQVRYQFKDFSLIIEICAVSDQDTIFNPTNHAYFNFELPQGILSHELIVNSDFFTDCTADGYATGAVLPVFGPLDLKKTKRLQDILRNTDSQITRFSGIDHNFILNKQERAALSHAATLISRKSKIAMDIYTTLPCLQVYSGIHNHWIGKNEIRYEKSSGIALETQLFPDAMRLTHFPSPVLRKGKQYYSRTEYRFS